VDTYDALDDEPLWGLALSEPDGPADHVDELLSTLLDISDDLCRAVTWLAENWSLALPEITWTAGNKHRGCALRLMVAAADRNELGELAWLLGAPVAATGAHHDKLWWHAERRFGTVLLDAFYGEPIGPTATAYLARYLDKATGTDEAGAA
jgi:hypothetical protein